MSNYDVYSAFDIQKHKETFTNYLEVIIGESGRVVYAVPSHQRLMEELACAKLHCEREELSELCPREYWADYMAWLCNITGAIAVWNDFCKATKVNKRQIATLKALKLHGLYHGTIPHTNQDETTQQSVFKDFEKFG